MSCLLLQHGRYQLVASVLQLVEADSEQSALIIIVSR